MFKFFSEWLPLLPRFSLAAGSTSVVFLNIPVFETGSCQIWWCYFTFCISLQFRCTSLRTLPKTRHFAQLSQHSTCWLSFYPVYHCSFWSPSLEPPPFLIFVCLFYFTLFLKHWSDMELSSLCCFSYLSLPEKTTHLYVDGTKFLMFNLNIHIKL